VSAAAWPQTQTIKHTAKKPDRQQRGAQVLSDMRETLKNGRGTTRPDHIRDIERNLGRQIENGRKSTSA
jgi:hypothetical protein